MLARHAQRNACARRTESTDRHSTPKPARRSNTKIAETVTIAPVARYGADGHRVTGPRALDALEKVVGAIVLVVEGIWEETMAATEK